MQTERYARRCRTARVLHSPLRDRQEAEQGLTEIGLLRRVLALAVPVDVELLIGSLDDLRQTVDAVVDRPDLPDEAVEMLSVSLACLRGTIDEIRSWPVIPAPREASSPADDRTE